MKTTQSLSYCQDGQEFTKRLSHCNLKERVFLYSTKEIVKEYISNLKDKLFKKEEFKTYFENETKSLFNIEVLMDENTLLAYRNEYVFMFYFFENDVKKWMQVCVKN